MMSNPRRSKTTKSSSSPNASSESEPSRASKVCKVHKFSLLEIENLRQQLLSWYDKKKRDLPWRRLSAQETDRNRRGYAVWVSEVMLQQTQVATVIEYYNKWMKRWPSLQDLAKASLEEVNEMWAGLGYYSRARRLHEGSKKVVNEMNGEMPNDAAGLMKSLPGVGRYTAAAIASIAFNEPVGLVDGNVVRVLSRLRIIGTDSSSTVAVDMFWKLADKLIVKDCPGDFNQAMMELGAMVCTPKSPQCNTCPVEETCHAVKQTRNSTSLENGIESFFEGGRKVEQKDSDALTDIEELIANDCQLCLVKDSTWDPELGVCNYPRKAKPKEARQERVAVCILECQAKANKDILVFLAKRPSSGLLAGLWEFPNIVVETDSSDQALATKIREFLEEEFMICLPTDQEVSLLGQVVHLFSHIHHTYVVHKVVLNDKPSLLSGGSVNGRSTKWVPQSEFLEMAVSTAMKKVYNVYKNNVQLKKAGIKRKRNEKDNSKRQRVLDSFFKKDSGH